MSPQVLSIDKQVDEKQVRISLDNHFHRYSAEWFTIQQLWLSNAYNAYKDHDKYLILYYLAKKVLNFYSEYHRILNWDQFFNLKSLVVGKISINVISRDLNISRETTRRKISELIKDGVIHKKDNKIIIDAQQKIFIKSKEIVKRISLFLHKYAEGLYKDKIIKESIGVSDIQKVILKNYSYAWKLWFDIQIPFILERKTIFKDVESFHIWATCIQNQNYEVQKFVKKNSLILENYTDFLHLHTTVRDRTGINAMSISAISGIPRATVIRKIKYLLKKKMLYIDKNKLYHPDVNFLTSNIITKLFQNTFLDICKFTTRIINLTFTSN